MTDENTIKILEMLRAIMDRLDVLEAKQATNPLPILREPIEHGAFPALSEMNNLELTLFDNGRKQGRPRFAMKAEVNVASGKFAAKRDYVAVADMYDSAVLWGKLGNRAISDEYRDLLKALLTQIDTTREAALVGMFGKRGGTAGQTWFDRQFVVLYHNGEYLPLHADFCIGGEVHHTSSFDREKHPLTGKRFALMADGRRIAGKAIDVFSRTKPQAPDEAA